MATSKGIYGIDRWICGVRVLASDIDTTVGRFGGTLRINAGGVLNATLTTAATYWWLYGNPFSTTDEQDFQALYPSFYFGLIAALTSAAGGTWTIGAYTLAGAAVPKTGVYISWSGGSWSIDWGNTNLNPEWLGFDRSVTGTTTSDSGGTIWSPKSVKPQWVSHSLNDGRASQKLPIKMAKIEHSSDRIQEAYPNARADEPFRQYTYRYCPEVVTFGELINSTPDARIGGVSPGDDHNAFINVHEYMKFGDAVIVVHDEGDQDHQVIGHEYEICALSFDQRMSSQSLISDSGIAGRFYDITPMMGILGGNYGSS
jgi:hypothetical protein